MREMLKALRNKIKIGVVGGSDFNKVNEQLENDVFEIFDYSFFENGLVAYKGKNLLEIQNLTKYIGEEKLKIFLDFSLDYIDKLDIPVKTSNFAELRNGMMNICPVGRNCSYDERIEFEKYDKIHKIRETMINVLKENFTDYNFTYSIGGMISFDVFPVGWDKTFCLKFLNDFDTIYFFGDKTHKGGNDHEIYESERTIGYTVTSPDDTIRICKEIFNI
jgi:phosphomannomutase